MNRIIKEEIQSMKEFFSIKWKFVIYVLAYLFTLYIIYLSITLTGEDYKNDEDLKLILQIFIILLIVKYIKIIFLFVLAPWQRVIKKIRERDYNARGFAPKVSILVPAYNEEVGILSTVESIARSTYRKIELIVINDGSTDNSDKIMRDFIDRYNFRKRITKDGIDIKYFYKENGGKAKALNFALARATGDIIITVDADCVVDKNAIGNFIKPFADPKIDVAVGNVKIGNTESAVTTVQFLEFMNSFYSKAAEEVLGAIYIVGGAAAAFNRNVFERVGLYDHTNITEDIEVSLKARKHGMNIAYASDAIIYTEGAPTLEGLVKQRTRWKIGWFQTMGRHKEIVFSKKKEHNKILSWIMIPLVFFGNLQLFFEPWFIAFIFWYSYVTNDFSSFSTWIAAESSIMISIMVIERKHVRPTLLGLIPITWILLYTTSYVEYRAVMKTIWKKITKEEVKWQKWERTGVDNSVKKIA